MTPAVSILLPVRDGAATVTGAVESCLVQTHRDFELLIADDNSSDGTVALLGGLSRRDRRVRILDVPPPGGLIPALRLLTREARAPLLARMDADDLSHPERIDKQAAHLRGDAGLAAVGCLVRVRRRDGDGFLPPEEGFRRYMDWMNNLVEPEDIARERFIESPVVHPSVMIRASALAAVGGYREVPWAEDYDLWLRLIEGGHLIGRVPEELFEWRDSPARLTRTDGRYRQSAFIEAKAHFLARLPVVRECGVAISGAGPTGKALARALQHEGAVVHYFSDTSVRRAGRRIAGVPVIAPGDTPVHTKGAPLHLAAVGQPGRRDAVRELLRGLGYTEGSSFLCVA